MKARGAALVTTLLAALVATSAPAGEPITERNIRFLEYPDFPEAHSSWGSIGYSARYDKVYVGVTDHRTRNALYEYDVATQALRLLGFVAEMAGLRDFQWQGKIHTHLVEGPDGPLPMGPGHRAPDQPRDGAAL